MSSSSSSSRSTDRHFVFIVTNHPDFRRLRSSTPQELRREPSDREQLLRNLLRVELRAAVHHYLSRTHRSFSSMRYVFLIPDVETEE